MSRSASPASPSRSSNFLIKAIVALSMAIGIVAIDSASADAEAANSKYAGIVVDANTGNVLYSENADRLQYPASLTKMMTLYLTFEALEQRRIRLDTAVPFSAHASGQAPTKRGVRPGGHLRFGAAWVGAGHSLESLTASFLGPDGQLVSGRRGRNPAAALFVWRLIPHRRPPESSNAVISHGAPQRTWLPAA